MDAAALGVACSGPLAGRGKSSVSRPIRAEHLRGWGGGRDERGGGVPRVAGGGGGATPCRCAGGCGAVQQANLCHQFVTAVTIVGVCESLLYGYKAGLDLNRMLESIRGGAAACWTLDNLAPKILQRNFDPGFFVEHFIKDMGMALEEAKRMGLVLPGLTLAHQLYQTVQTLGHGRSGTHALILALEELSKTTVFAKMD